MDLIYLAQNRGSWRVLMNVLVTLRVL